jgi:hypothetical protein
LKRGARGIYNKKEKMATLSTVLPSRVLALSSKKGKKKVGC